MYFGLLQKQETINQLSTVTALADRTAFNSGPTMG